MLESAERVRVACCQLRPRFGDVEWNRGVARRAIREAAAGGAGLIVLPELCTTGYMFESAAEAADPPVAPSPTGTSNDALGDRRPDLYRVGLSRGVGGLADGLEHIEHTGVG